jgi:hypothetical protein
MLQAMYLSGNLLARTSLASTMRSEDGGERIAEVIQRAEDEVFALLKANWSIVKRVANALCRRDRLSANVPRCDGSNENRRQRLAVNEINRCSHDRKPNQIIGKMRL